jgi:hypothetical protein
MKGCIRAHNQQEVLHLAGGGPNGHILLMEEQKD